ncbi:hypothetical protein SAMN05421839_1731 [Halolactibacillus halophilus]|uniref:Uncharacterized protein n=1 Tax=Halolactibacillus halophilus TaxID=306540 RepID=A0A1I5TD93_9BACI|nr:hypothetical protein [Halolactibacillus halophilus]GEM02951.1 hypothetical protein HHA03_24830 [Halolactibacillus halophilus]SFP80396.1 hypothetical protein SAMN05421839_1731 [Halolactibacillus halophilus]
MSSKNPNTHKILDFSSDDIKKYLVMFRRCVLEGRYSIAKNTNRLENMSFIEDYKVNSKREKEILLDLKYDDFCYAVENEKINYAHEILYVFCKQYELDFWGELENVEIYIKVNMIELKSGDARAFVVSFHKRNFEMTYLFR